MNCSSFLNIYSLLVFLLFSFFYLTWNAYDTSYCILSNPLDSSISSKTSVNGYFVGNQNDGTYSRKDYINILFQFPDFFQLHELKSTSLSSDYVITKVQIRSDGNANYYLWGIIHVQSTISTMVYMAYNDKMTDMYAASFPPTTGWTYLLPVAEAGKRLDMPLISNNTMSHIPSTTSSSSTINMKDSDIIDSRDNLRLTDGGSSTTTSQFTGSTLNLTSSSSSSSSSLSLQSSSTLSCHCYGYPSVMNKNIHKKPSNISLMLHHPITTLFIIIMCYIAFHIWQHHMDTSGLTLSYDNIINSHQYYRIITASVSHFDLLHLGFNMYALYQLMDVEVAFDSVKYAYLSIDLIFITIGIFLFIYHILIFKFHQLDLLQSSVVGYSCVVFAWMVAYSATLKQFCPIMFFPSFCFSTYYILPGFPINLAPILLLVITKLIIPRSSFTGHLAGIIIGYPLTWGLLNWCTPPILITIVSVGFIRYEKLFFWKIHVYNNDPSNSVLVINNDDHDNNGDVVNEFNTTSNANANSNNSNRMKNLSRRIFQAIRPYISSTNMADFITPSTTASVSASATSRAATASDELTIYYMFIIISLTFLFILLLSIFISPLHQLLPRTLLMLLVYGTWQYRRCMYLCSDNNSSSSNSMIVSEQSLVWFQMTMSVIICFIFIDSWSLGTALVNKTYLLRNDSNNDNAQSSLSSLNSLVFYYYSISVYILLIQWETVYLFTLSALLQYHIHANALLARCHMDWSQLKPLVARCGYCCRCCSDSGMVGSNSNVRTYGRGTLLPTTVSTTTSSSSSSNSSSSRNDSRNSRTRTTANNNNSNNNKSSDSKTDRTSQNMKVLKDRIKINKGNGSSNNNTNTTATTRNSSSSNNHFNYSALPMTVTDEGDTATSTGNSNSNTKTTSAPYVAVNNSNNDHDDDDDDDEVADTISV